MSSNRPINLDLMSVHFPVMAIASITHRVCAVISWVGLGALIFSAHYATTSEQHFNQYAMTIHENFFGQFMVWGIVSAFTYYCLATLKHLIQDLGFCEELSSGRNISWLVLILGGAASIAIGAEIWI